MKVETCLASPWHIRARLKIESTDVQYLILPFTLVITKLCPFYFRIVYIFYFDLTSKIEYRKSWHFSRTGTVFRLIAPGNFRDSSIFIVALQHNMTIIYHFIYVSCCGSGSNWITTHFGFRSDQKFVWNIFIKKYGKFIKLLIPLRMFLFLEFLPIRYFIVRVFQCRSFSRRNLMIS